MNSNAHVSILHDRERIVYRVDLVLRVTLCYCNNRQRFVDGAPTLFLRTTMSAPLNLDEEVRLYTTNAEREKYGLLATLFGIIVALEYLERAYVRDSITTAE